MSSEMVISIVDRVKNFLGQSENLPSAALHDKLWKLRNSFHPDLFFDEASKKKAEEKFKEISSLLKQLSDYIDQERLNRNPSDITLYQKEFEIINNRQEIVRNEEELDRLKTENTWLHHRIDDLQKEINKFKIDGEGLQSKKHELIAAYKPSRKSIVSLGITFLLTILGGLVLKIESIANTIVKYSPFRESTLNTIIFAVFLFVLLCGFRWYLKEKTINDISKNVLTPRFISNFNEYRKEHKVYGAFCEHDVYSFIESSLISTNPVKRFFQMKVFCLYTDSTLDILKDIFIYNLLCKSLIVLHDADNLQRYFQVKHKRDSSLNELF